MGIIDNIVRVTRIKTDSHAPIWLCETQQGIVFNLRLGDIYRGPLHDISNYFLSMNPNEALTFTMTPIRVELKQDSVLGWALDKQIKLPSEQDIKPDQTIKIFDALRDYEYQNLSDEVQFLRSYIVRLTDALKPLIESAILLGMEETNPGIEFAQRNDEGLVIVFATEDEINTAYQLAKEQPRKEY